MLNFVRRIFRGGNALGAVLVAILAGCALQPIAGPEGVLKGEERPGGGPLLDCRGYFSQAQREFKASISALSPTGAGVGLGVGAGSSQLMALDSITGDMIIHYQRYCQQYNAGLISREEFLRRTDTLQATQTAVRTMVGAAPIPPLSSPGSPMPAPSWPSASPEVYPDGTTKPMRVADAVFKLILEAMRPAPGTTAPQPVPPVVVSPPPPLSLPPPSVPLPFPRSGAETPPPVQDPFVTIVTELTQIASAQRPGQGPVRAVLGEINYRDTEFASPLSVFLKGRLREQLGRSGAFLLVEAPRFRTIGVAERPKSGAALAEASGADVVISGNYWEASNGVELFVSVRQRQGDVLLGVARAQLPSSALPPDTPVAPANLASARINERIEDRIAPLSSLQAASPLKVEVWTDRGRGAVYADGDEVLVLVRVSEDAYLRLYYTDANNQTYQVFPNQYRREGRVRAEAVVTIPTQEDRFVFKVKPPFGVESITVLASRKPFVGPPSGGVSVGPFQQVPQGIRGLEVVASSAGDGEVVRDRVVLTSVPKR